METELTKPLSFKTLNEIKELVKDFENLPTIKSKIIKWKKEGYDTKELERLINPVYEKLSSVEDKRFTAIDKTMIFSSIFFFIFVPIGRFLFMDIYTFPHEIILWILSENIVGLTFCSYPIIKGVGSIKRGLVVSISGYIIGLLSFLIIIGTYYLFLRFISSVLLMLIIYDYFRRKYKISKIKN